MALENEKTQGLVLFSHIARLGSLSAAAQANGLSRSTVSKQLAALEQRIGSRLFNRTTRKIRLTDVGRQVLSEARHVERALQAIEHISEDYQSEMSGTLNVTCATAQGRVHLVPLLARFVARYPLLRVNLQLEDRVVDMVAEDVDVCLRVGLFPDSSLIARKIGDLTGVLCASPAYLRDAPPLQCPSDLVQHRCLFYRNASMALDTWTLMGPDGEETVKVTGPLSINDLSALLLAAMADAGVLLCDQSLLGTVLSDGALVPVLPEYRLVGSLPMYIVYPEKEFVPARTRALVDFLLAEMPQAIGDSEQASDPLA